MPSRNRNAAILVLFVALTSCGCEERANSGRSGQSKTSEKPFVLRGITSPKILSANEATISGDQRVIGVSVGNSHRAYLIEAFEAPNVPLNPSQIHRLRVHVVNDVIDGKAVTVTYCDDYQCARVFWDPKSKRPLKVGLAGMQDKEMQLFYNGKRFGQTAEAPPLQIYKFEVMTWKEWKKLHPNTKLYIGKRKTVSRKTVLS